MNRGSNPTEVAAGRGAASWGGRQLVDGRELTRGAQNHLRLRGRGLRVAAYIWRRPPCSPSPRKGTIQIQTIAARTKASSPSEVWRWRMSSRIYSGDAQD